MTQMMAAVPVQLLDPALRAFVLAAVAGMALAIFQARTTSLRLFAWKSVLYAALAMPFLAWMLPPLAVPVPTLLQNSPAEISSTTEDSKVSAAPLGVSVATRRLSKRAKASEQTPQASPQIGAFASHAALEPGRPAQTQRLSVPWGSITTAIYLAVALLLLARMIIGIMFSRRLIRKSQRICDPRITGKLAAHSGGLVIEAVESSLISVPVTIGITRSKIVLPANWREWDNAKLDAILAHELSHVTRHDALTQFVSLLHRAIFWFSPLAWWLDRHLADLAEQASDEAALCCGVNRNDYARTLLGFFEALHAAPGRVWWQGVSMAKPGQAEKRLERILAWKGMVNMSLKTSVVVMVFALAIPAVYLTAAVRPSQDTPTAPPAPQATPAPSASASPSVLPPPAPAARVSPRPVVVAPVAPIVLKNGQMYIPAPVAPVAAIYPPVPPAPRAAQNYSYSAGSSYSSGKGYSYAFGYDEEQRFVIVSGKSDSLTMSGTGEDARHVEKLKKQISGDFIWFSRDEKSYIIRDQATITRARGFWAPQEELGKKQEALGKQQEELGAQQEALGKKQEEVRVKVPDMTAELDRLKAKLQKLGPTATMEQLGDLQSEIGDLQSKIGDIESEAGEQQGKLGDEQGALGERQGKLGEEQGKLGEQQAALAEKATREMKQLLDEALKNGTAQPEPESGGGAGTL